MAGGASTLRDSLLPAVDVIRGIPGALGLRLFSVAITKRVWSGPRIGLGTNTDTTSGIKVDVGIFPVKIRQLTTREIIASAGQFRDEDIEVGPITPPYTGSTLDNDAISIFDPPEGTFEEIFFNITGPGYPTGGAWFDKVKQTVTPNFRYMFVLRKNGRQP